MNESVSEPARDAYDYEVDLQADTAPAKIAHLVGRDKKVLEIGCGPGSQSRIFRHRLGCRVIGLEIDPERAAIAQAFCERVHVADVETADLDALIGNDRFDVVVCADVLEHLRDPAAVLRRLAPLLAPDGFLLVSIPNVTHAAVVFEMAHGRFEYRDYGLLDRTHIRFFCRSTALELMESTGYAVAELHCVKRKASNTEFETMPIGSDDGALLEMISSRNQDSLTYQFVLKAVPAVGAEGPNHGAMLVGAQLRKLEVTVADQQAEIKRLNSTIAWIEGRPLMRLYRKLRAALGMR